MIVFGYRVEAARWPWQKGYNWKGMTSPTAPLNTGGARFGAGWKYALGVRVGGSTVHFELVFGSVSVTKADKCLECGEWIDGPRGPAMDKHNERDTHYMHKEYAETLKNTPGYYAWSWDHLAPSAKERPF